MFMTAYKPDEQSLFTAKTLVSTGYPARMLPILAVICPAPVYKQFPTQMSSTSFGSIFACS